MFGVSSPLGGDTPVSNILFMVNLIVKKIFGGPFQFAVTGGGSIGSNLHYFAQA